MLANALEDIRGLKVVIDEKEFYASLYDHYGSRPYWNAR